MLWQICLKAEPHITALHTALTPWRHIVARVDIGYTIEMFSKRENEDIMNRLQNAIVMTFYSNELADVSKERLFSIIRF